MKLQVLAIFGCLVISFCSSHALPPNPKPGLEQGHGYPYNHNANATYNPKRICGVNREYLLASRDANVNLKSRSLALSSADGSVIDKEDSYQPKNTSNQPSKKRRNHKLGSRRNLKGRALPIWIPQSPTPGRQVIYVQPGTPGKVTTVTPGHQVTYVQPGIYETVTTVTPGQQVTYVQPGTPGKVTTVTPVHQVTYVQPGTHETVTAGTPGQQVTYVQPVNVNTTAEQPQGGGYRRVTGLEIPLIGSFDSKTEFMKDGKFFNTNKTLNLGLGLFKGKFGLEID